MFELFSFTDDRKDLFAALIKAQAAMGCAVKDSKNPHFRSSYASLSAVIDAVIPVLNEHGVGVLQMPHLDETQVQLTTVLLHSSGQMVSSTVATPMGKKNDAQAVGSAITYLRRYSLQAIMGLPVEDDDGNAASRQDRVTWTGAPSPRQTQRRQVPPTKDWRALIVAELRAQKLTVDHFDKWAQSMGRATLANLNPAQLNRCHEWLTHGNGIAMVKAAAESDG
jgi:hypothetical protein